MRVRPLASKMSRTNGGLNEMRASWDEDSGEGSGAKCECDWMQDRVESTMGKHLTSNNIAQFTMSSHIGR
jgi:hypothetical protein